VLVSVLVAASLGDWVGGLFGGFVAALLAIPLAGAFQVVVVEAWRLTAPPSERHEEERAVIDAAGGAATDAHDLAQEGVDDDHEDEAAIPAGRGPRDRPAALPEIG